MSQSIPPVISCIREMVKFRGVTTAIHVLGIGKDTIYAIMHNDRPKLYYETIKRLYEKLDLKEDEYWKTNLAAWNQATSTLTPLGGYLREKRIACGLTISEAAKRIKVDIGTIKRIESGANMPHPFAYTINKLIEIYQCSESEKDTIRWHIVLTQDIASMTKAVRHNALATRQEDA